MKSSIIVIAFILWINMIGAQPIQINDLNIPTSPAFVLLGKSPATIEKPSNPKAVGLSLINLWQSSGAIEFTPYWLSNKPAYTFADNIKNKNPIFQTLAFSIASSKDDSISNIAVGFRTQLAKSYSQNTIKLIEEKLTELENALGEGENIDQNKIKSLHKDINKLKAQTNWVLELAGAFSGTSSTTESITAQRSGIWANLKWTPDNSPITLVGLARYLSTKGNPAKLSKDSSFFDYGINISHQGDEFDLQFEFVKRNSKVDNASYDRLVFIANYQIMPGIVAVASFGKDYTKVNNVFSAIGIKFGLSTEKMRAKS